MGTEFILAIPRSSQAAERIHIYIVSTFTSFNGSITSPIPGVSQTFSTSNGSVTIQLPVTAVLPEGKSNYVIQIKTSKDAAVYGILTQSHFLSDGFYVYPSNFFGYDYIVISYEPTEDRTFLAILSTADNTEVNVTIKHSVSYNGIFYMSGTNIRISMDKLEAVQLLSSRDLSGSTIHSNKPVAVLSGNQCTKYKHSSFCNYLVEYLAPNTACGRQFIVPPFNGSSKWLRIFSTGDHANISINGTSATTAHISVTKTSHLEKEVVAGESYAIESDQPVCVYMLLIIGTSPMLTAIPSLDQYVHDAVVPIPTIDQYETSCPLLLNRLPWPNCELTIEHSRPPILRPYSLMG